MPVDVKCNCCLTYGPVSQFKFLSCGHCCCSSCATRILATLEPQCPTCRAPIGPHNNFFKIYATFSESVVDKVERVIDGLDKIDESVPIQSLRKAGPQARKAVHDISAAAIGDVERGQVQERLIDAMERLEARLESTSRLLEERQKEVERRAKLLERHHSVDVIMEENNWDTALQVQRRLNSEQKKGGPSSLVPTTILGEQNARLSSQLQDRKKRIAELEVLLQEKEGELHKQAQLYRHKLKGIRQRTKKGRNSTSVDDGLIVLE